MKRILLFALLTGTAFAQSKPPGLRIHARSPSAAHHVGKRLGAAMTCPALPGGTPHEIEFCWTTPQAGTTALFLAPGACPASGVPAGAQVTSSAALTGSYIDTAVTAATTYCGYATVSGVTAPSNTVQVTIPVFAPTNLTGTQSATTETLTWTASKDAGTTVTVYIANSACGTTGQTFATYGVSGSPSGPFPITLSGLNVGTYCVELKAAIGGVTSPVSNTFQFQEAVVVVGNPPSLGISAQ
jgi:hypothetical protein